MLHKQRSNSNSQWKYALMIPLILAFVFTFNAKTIAQQKKANIIKQKIEVFAMGITKESTQTDLNKIIKSFAEKGLTVKFNNVKRNSDNEIIAIKIDAKTKNGKASAAFGSNIKEGINHIKITFDKENNNLSIGSSEGHNMHTYSFSNDGHRKMIKRHKKRKGKSFVFISDDEDGDTNIWVTKDGDTTKVINKKMNVKIHKDHDSDSVHEFIIDEDEDTEGKMVKKKIIRIKGEKGKGNYFFVSEDDDDENTTTTYIVNGKKMTKEEFKKFDKDKIETIEIKKEIKKVKKED